MRKYICITYHMAKLDGETAETCIDLPMDEKIADDILRAQRDSRYVKDAAWPIASILQNLAKLQGYDSSAFCMFNGEQGPQVSLELQDSRLQLGMTENAHRQIGTHLNIPAKYYELMRKENPELLVQNVNSWLEKNPTRRLVRALDGDMRAFLSDRYRCIDNLDIAECVLPIISKMPDATIESCEVTDDRMYIKVVNPRIQAEVVPGDIVQSGMLISNSEVGLGGVVVQPLIYRLVCTNGMVVNAAGEKRRHIGRIQNFSENRELFRDETLKADDRAFMMKLRDIVSATVDQTQFDKVLDIMRQAKRNWFEMIASGEKKEEYRAANSYYDSRLMKYKNEPIWVALRNGYRQAGCHSVCERYIRWKKELEAEKAYSKQFAPIDAMNLTHEQEKKNRQKRYKGGNQ